MAKERFTLFTVYAVLVAALGGFLYGYHIAAISGALLFIAEQFTLTSSQEGTLVSLLLLGSLFGALCSGALADRVGRKPALLLTAAIFIGGTGIVYLATSFSTLMYGRAILGFAIGLVSLLVPLYLAEISPPHSRGAFVSINQLAITIGILIAYFVNYLYADTGNWRMMFAWGMAPALLQIIGGIFLPETPSWLMANRQETAAIQAFTRLRRDREWKGCLTEMQHSASPRKDHGWKALLQSRFRFVLILGLCIATFQQITGINTVIFYAPKIFQVAGFSSASNAIFATVSIGIMNVVATALSVWLLDRLGRRPLLLFGVGGMIISLLVLSGAFFVQSSSIGLIAVISLMSYVACFGIGLGPITWLLLSEIYPLSIRGKAMTLAISLNSLANYVVSLVFLDLIGALGISWTFILFAGIGIIALGVIWRYVPETKGKRLEEIEKELIN